MNSPSTPEQPSKIQQGEFKRSRGLTKALTMDAEGDSAIERLPNEVLLNIFGFLLLDDILTAEKVCQRWKAVVDTFFATAKTLCFYGGEDDLQTLRRFGPSMKGLALFYCDNKHDWIAEIVKNFPNLSELILTGVPLSKKGCKTLAVNYCKLTRLSLTWCDVNNQKMAILLKGFPELKYLQLYLDVSLGRCFRELGSNLEHFIANCEITKAGTSHIFSKCTNLKSFQLSAAEKCDANIFTTFCKKAPLRSLKLSYSRLPKKVFLSISHLYSLETLKLKTCEKVDSHVLISIIVGCPNLKNVSLVNLPLVCDRGLKALAQLTHLSSLRCRRMDKMTDESLVEIAIVGLLKSLRITDIDVGDRGLSAVLALCPRLDYLAVKDCSSGVSDITLNAAIQAVENRSSSAVDQSPRNKFMNIEIFPKSKADKMRRYSLNLCFPAKGRIRYKTELSHTSLSVEGWKVSTSGFSFWSSGVPSEEPCDDEEP